MLKKEIQQSHNLIKPFIHRTPILSSRLINNLTRAKLYFKCENFQRMGAFKMRGACNAILNLSAEDRARGVVTHSSGNMAQAVALAARLNDIKAYIVMPANAPRVKIEAVREYGAEIKFCAPIIEERQYEADKIVSEKGASFIHPSNDLNVILGQGTAAKELLEDVQGLNIIVAPVGGGGLLAGTSIAVSSFSEKCETIGAEPEAANDAFRSLQSGRIEFNSSANTIADGLRTHLGDVNFPIIKEGVKCIVTVSEDEIINAMRLVYERMKIIIEPSSAVAVASLFKRNDLFAGLRVGVILSGGNVDLSALPF